MVVSFNYTNDTLMEMSWASALLTFSCLLAYPHTLSHSEKAKGGSISLLGHSSYSRHSVLLAASPFRITEMEYHLV